VREKTKRAETGVLHQAPGCFRRGSEALPLVEVKTSPDEGGRIAASAILKLLREEYGARLVLHEGGPTLVGEFSQRVSYRRTVSYDRASSRRPAPRTSPPWASIACRIPPLKRTLD
jgi:hypothetical protein